MIKSVIFSAMVGAIGSAASGQTLSPEQIAAMVDERVATLNPYQVLLNDPDPQRSLAAMEIMLESGNADLGRMALEYGLLSPSPTVRRTAVEAFLTTQPVLSMRFEGDPAWSNYQTVLRQTYSGTMTPDGTGFWRVPVGEYSAEEACFLRLDTREPTCLVTVNADGIFLTADSLTGRVEVNDEGELAGFGSMRAVSEPVPLTIRLLD